MKRILAGFLLALALIALAACGGSDAGSSAMLSFSDAPGVYTKRFKLYIDCADPSLKVYYTIDSSAPTDEAEEYSAETGIEIGYRGGGGTDPSSVNIIRAAAFDDEGVQVGEALSGTFILTDSPAVRYSTMIVSIVAEPDDLYGFEEGILVAGKKNADFKKQRPVYWTNESLEDANYFGSGIEWERAASVEFFDQNGGRLYAQDVGVRVSGGWNRKNKHKSLRLFARYIYDDANVMRADVYPGLTSLSGVPVTAHKTLILRTGSNNTGNTVIQTPFLMQLGEEMGLETMHYRPVCVYVNGKYYGYMALLEDYSPTYFEQHYNIPAEEITCINGAGKISGGRGWFLDNGPEEEAKEFRKMLNYIISADMTDPKHYEEASRRLDFDSFIKYMCFEGYIGNSDWPQNNTRVWRRWVDGYNPDAAEYGYDGRWRFLLKDLDLSGGFGADGVDASMFKRLDSDDGGLRLNAMFQSLFKNANFRNRVFCCLSDMLSTTMSLENVMDALGETALSAQLEMRYYIPSYSVAGGTLSKWHNHLRTPYKFFRQRWTNVYNELPKKYDSVWGELNVRILGEGTLDISTLSLTESAELNYMVGLKIPVEATPAEGWKLSGIKLSAGSVRDGVFMMASKSLTLTVTFEEDPAYMPPAGTLRINEVKYEYPRTVAECDYVEIYNGTDTAVYLKGYSLEKSGLRADGTPDTDRWSFPASSIGPGEYITVCFDKNGVSTGRAVFRAAHGLGAGDTLTLLDRNGEPVDAVTLPSCGNETSYARDDNGWYFAPQTTLGEENVRAAGYELASVLDERTRGAFLHDGRIVSGFAKPYGGGYVITEAVLRKQFTAEKVEKAASALAKCRVSGGYDLREALAALGYEMFHITALDSYIIVKK